jgi:hypothetical protein
MESELDLSWIYEEESNLVSSQDIALRPLQRIPIVAVYIDSDRIVNRSEKVVVELAVSDDAHSSSLSSDQIVRHIQSFKIRSSEKWTWFEGLVFHIDVDINNVYHFSTIFGAVNYLKPLDVYRDLALIENPTVYHSYSQIYLFFKKTDADVQSPYRSILKPISSGEVATKTTKKVRISLPKLADTALSAESLSKLCDLNTKIKPKRRHTRKNVATEKK